MFCDQLRASIEAAPRCELTKISALLWKACAAGQVSEAEAAALSEAIELKRALPPPQKPVQRRFSSRPRSPASLERRRRWAASGRLPPQLACRFTLAEQAVLAVVAVEVAKQGTCTLALDHIASLAGVSRATVRNAMKQARTIGCITVEERRASAWRNLPNVVRIVSPEWQAWMRLARRSDAKGGGRNSVSGTSTDREKK